MKEINEKDFKEFIENLSKEEQKDMRSFARLLTKFLAEDDIQAKVIMVYDEVADIEHEIMNKLINNKDSENEAKAFIETLGQIKCLLNDFKKENLSK